jgi:hypothetical protein
LRTMGITIPIPWSLTYVLSAFVAIALSVDLFRRDPKSPQHGQFLTWGISSSLYLIIVFFVLNAGSADEALEIFRFSNMFYFISIGLLAQFTYNLLTWKDYSWLLLVGPMLVVPVSFFIPYNVRLTDLGWVVSARPTLTIEGALAAVYLLSYSLLIAASLYQSVAKARTPWLSRKYTLMLLGFVVFQMVGVQVLNALMLISDSLPHVAGLMYFLSLIFLWYGFKMEQPRGVEVTKAGNGFSDAYGRFINRFLQVAPSDELGLKTVNLLEYLDKTRLSEYVTYNRLRIILNVEKLEQLDNIQALDKTMEYLESKNWSDKLAGPFTEVLESVYASISSDREKAEAFKEVLTTHQAFLMETDTIYGFSRGQFLELVGPDESLAGLPEWKVALRIYRRSLLPIRGFITGPIVAEFHKKIGSMDIVKYLDVSHEGEIGIDRVQSYIEGLPEERKVNAVRVGFNPLMSWLARTLATKDPSSFEKWLRSIRRIVLLNGDAKGVWGTYVSVTNRLSTDLGRDWIRGLILLEGRGPEDLDGFSSLFGLSHGRMAHERILVEYDPRYAFEYYVGRLLDEISANTERSVVFTRGGSRTHRMATGIENAECRVLATPGLHDKGSLPFNDVTMLIDAVGKAMESEMETWVVFDNLSDLILPVGLEQAYVFARHATDLIGSKNGSAAFLLNRSAHSQADRAAFEGLFSTIVEIGEKVTLVKR